MNKFLAFLGWPPRDMMAFVALLFSILGSAALTVFSAWLVWILWRGGWSAGTEVARIDALAKMALMALALSGVVLVSLGLAINRRSIKLDKDGFEISGGGEE